MSPRLDISRLRKDHGMSQNELAQKLQITQSFLSAIENGKSPLPPEKEEKILEIFNLQDLSGYTNDFTSSADNAKQGADMTDSELFNQLLSRFHRQAHSKEDNHHHSQHHQRIESLEQNVESLLMRNERLMERNDALAAENEMLRATVDGLRTEIYKLKSLLLKAGISDF